MSKWRELDIDDKIIRILREIPDAAPEHHLGRPFLTAYQIAIGFARRHPEETDQLGFPIGGAGTGQRNSLAQYLAGQMSRNIAAGRLSEMEGGFLSNQHLKDICFDVGEQIISGLCGGFAPHESSSLGGSTLKPGGMV